MTSLEPSIKLEAGSWTDQSRTPKDRVANLINSMTLREKVAQLYGTWVGANSDGDEVAPHQNDMAEVGDFDELLQSGLGQLTRAFGTAPIDAAVGAASLVQLQRRIVAANRFRIPALAHEECLAGFTAWGATVYPVPLAWGATFHPELVAEMATQIGEGMRAVGVHQGLAPVLDVTRDPRWGRTEETIGEDPYLVGTIATAYIQGLESTGIVATLKHFAGYSASKAARNLAPVSMGPREFADVILPPFEMAIRESGVRSVMHSYASVDGIPAAANAELLTTLLREDWGFTGTVVADYFGVGFLKLLHGVAETWGEAAAMALTAGVDVELPSAKAYAQPLVDEVTSGRLSERYVDRAVERVLLQKLELGLLDADWTGLPDGWADVDLSNPAELRGSIDLDPAANRALARTIAEEATVLVRNEDILPLSSAPPRIALIGPCADDPMTMMGCYSFPSHVGVRYPELPMGIDMPTVRAGLSAEFPGSTIDYVLGCPVREPDISGIQAAVDAASAADVAIVVLGDLAGLFGRGTSGEGCDVESLELPGSQAALLEAILECGVPVIVVMMSGRPYALGTAPDRAAAIVQSFFPGEEGASAIAGILSGRVAPSGRLPVSIPRHPGAQPSTYLAAKLSERTEVSNIDPTPAYGFGHGLGYTTIEWSDPTLDGKAVTADTSTAGDTDATPLQVPTDGRVSLGVCLRNPSARQSVEVVQLYLHDPVASVVQPVSRLVGYARVTLAAGETVTVVFDVPAELAAFTGASGNRIVEPGALELRLSRSSQQPEFTVPIRLIGEVRTLGNTRERHARAVITH